MKARGQRVECAGHECARGRYESAGRDARRHQASPFRQLRQLRQLTNLDPSTPGQQAASPRHLAPIRSKATLSLHQVTRPVSPGIHRFGSLTMLDARLICRAAASLASDVLAATLSEPASSVERALGKQNSAVDVGEQLTIEHTWDPVDESVRCLLPRSARTTPANDSAYSSRCWRPAALPAPPRGRRRASLLAMRAWSRRRMAHGLSSQADADPDPAVSTGEASPEPGDLCFWRRHDALDEREGERVVLACQEESRQVQLQCREQRRRPACVESNAIVSSRHGEQRTGRRTCRRERRHDLLDGARALGQDDLHRHRAHGVGRVGLAARHADARVALLARLDARRS